MSVYPYDLATFQKALLDHFPDGIAFPKDYPESVFVQTVNALAPTYERIGASSEGLIADAYPASTEYLLPDWEASLGLPDPCQGESPTVQARQAQVVARFAGSFPQGSLSIPSIVNYAANLGYAITITTFSPFYVGVMCAGDPVYGESVAYQITVNAPLYTQHFFQVGVDCAGEPLSWWGDLSP
jgi:uncharacterized protein YmfQ (DUF2313 family)